MIDDYRGLAIFVAVAKAGSFSAAARQLKLSTSVVSHHISRLEEKLGVTLFFRSTRSLSLTSEGDQILDAATRMVAAGEEAVDVLSGHADQPVGALRVASPAFGQCMPVHRCIWNFARAHPLVALSLSSSDQQVDIVREGFDIAIRLGKLADSGLKSRRVGTFRRVLVASPSYLSEHPTVRTIDDLAARDFIAISMLPDDITLLHKAETTTFTPQSFRVEVDSIAAAKAAVIAGLGIQHLPLEEVQPELDAGVLKEVLPSWKLPELGIFAVWPDIGPQKQLTRRFLDYLVANQDT